MRYLTILLVVSCVLSHTQPKEINMNTGCGIASINGQQTPYSSPMKSPLEIIAWYSAPDGLKSFEILFDGKVVIEEKIPVTTTKFTYKTHATGIHTVEIKIVCNYGVSASDTASITIG